MDDILTLIEARQSLRRPFEPGHPIAQQDLQKILEAARWSPTAHNMQNFQVVVVDDKKLLEEIGNIKSPASPIFIQENYQQLSFSEEELRTRKVGVLAAMFPSSWTSPEAKLGHIPEQVEGEGARPFPYCPVLLVIVYDPSTRAPASEGDFLGIMSLGCLMENMWLMAQALGIGFQIMSALGAGPVEQEVKHLLGIPEHLKIAFTARLGYASTPGKYLRVRREVDDFTHHNRFGQKGLN